MKEGRAVPNFVVWDVETGGFNGAKNPLVEVCFICYDGVTLDEIDRYEALVKPYYKNEITGEPLEYTSGAMNAHRITIAEMEEDGIPLKQVAVEVIAKLDSWKVGGVFGKPILVGHNIIKFDIPFITLSFEQVKLRDAFIKKINDQVMDTLYFSMFKFPTSKDKGDELAQNNNHKLGSICKAMGISLTGAHRAAADTEANAEVFIEFIKGIRGEGSDVSGGIVNKTNSLPFKF
jgi:DNA polymerase III alpha subunit (gram-positive type)